MRLRNQWHNIMEGEGMPFVQTTAPLKVFEKHIKELTDRGVTDEEIIESWRRFAVDARRGLIKRNTNPWFAYWGRRSKYLTFEGPAKHQSIDEIDVPKNWWDEDDREDMTW